MAFYLYQLLVTALSAAYVFCFLFLAIYGHQLHEIGRGALGMNQSRRSRLLAATWRLSRITTWVVAAMIALILAGAFIGGKHLPRTPLYVVHLVAATTHLLTFLAIRSKVNGDQYPYLHRWLAWACVISGAIMLPIGLIRLWSM
jgi:hypothetical protein